MALIGIHLVSYLAVNAFLVAVWLLLSGSADGLREISGDPTTANREGFWPVWVILSWGTVLVIHVLSHLWLRAVRVARRGPRRIRPQRHRRRFVPPANGRRWVAVMFTDIVDSTRLTEELGDAAWSAELGRHRGRVRGTIVLHGGVEVGTQGDGFLARFDRPADAVACALELQGDSGGGARRSDPAIRLRIGIHAGETVEDDGDLIGRVVNLASRVTAAARPGEVLVTEPVADVASDAASDTAAPGGIEFEDRGVHELKGIARPRHLFAARPDGRSL